MSVTIPKAFQAWVSTPSRRRPSIYPYKFCLPDYVRHVRTALQWHVRLRQVIE